MGRSPFIRDTTVLIFHDQICYWFSPPERVSMSSKPVRFNCCCYDRLSLSKRFEVHLVAVESASINVLLLLRQLLRLLLCRLLVESCLHDSQQWCRFHGFVRLSEPSAPLPSEKIVFLSNLMGSSSPRSLICLPDTIASALCCRDASGSTDFVKHQEHQECVTILFLNQTMRSSSPHDYNRLQVHCGLWRVSKCVLVRYVNIERPSKKSLLVRRETASPFLMLLLEVHLVATGPAAVASTLLACLLLLLHLYLLLSDCLHQLLLPAKSLLPNSQQLRRFHGFVSLSEQ